jgi:hypothetical protein
LAAAAARSRDELMNTKQSLCVRVSLERTRMSKPKLSRLQQVLWLLLGVVLGLVIFIGYFVWKVHSFQSQLFGFEPPEMAARRFTPKDVIGDLGGMRVLIPRHCAEFVTYNGDPTFGEKRKFSSEHLPTSKLRGFGVDVRFPEMRCKDNEEMREDRKRNFLNRENPWIAITVTSGEFYPSLGARATDNRAKVVTDTIDKPGKFWFDNFERLPTSDFGLEAYVVAGIDTRTGKPAKDSLDSNDVFIHRLVAGTADTYITCNKTESYRGVATCEMNFGMEPKARVRLTVRFVRSKLSEWRKIKQSTLDLLTSFEVREDAVGVKN